MKSCTCYALRAVDCTCLPAKYDEIYTTPEQEPVAWLHTKIEGVAVPHRPADLDKHPDRWQALYKEPPSCPTCKALSRAVMLDQTSHDTTPPQRKPLSDEEIEKMRHLIDWTAHWSYNTFARAIEAAHGITGENK
jgi:hypothetical protein